MANLILHLLITALIGLILTPILQLPLTTFLPLLLLGNIIPDLDKIIPYPKDTFREIRSWGKLTVSTFLFTYFKGHYLGFFKDERYKHFQIFHSWYSLFISIGLSILFYYFWLLLFPLLLGFWLHLVQDFVTYLILGLKGRKKETRPKEKKEERLIQSDKYVIDFDNW